jgi:hypothetical protein
VNCPTCGTETDKYFEPIEREENLKMFREILNCQSIDSIKEKIITRGNQLCPQAFWFVETRIEI